MNYLSHHGIPNQKWGERNGPPYPLSREEHNQVVRSGNIKVIKEHMEEFNDWEIEQALKRFNYNQKIESLTNKPETKKGRSILSDYTRKMSTASNVLRVTVNAAENGVKLYNVVAKTMNSLGGKNMKVIQTGGDHKKTDNKNKD